LDLAALNAGSAHADFFGGAVHHRANLLQVQVPAPLGYVVGVADPVPELGTAPADITYLRHDRKFSYLCFFSAYHRRLTARLSPCSAHYVRGSESATEPRA